MPPTIEILILGAALLCFSTATVYRRISCDEFSKDSNFVPSQAVGDWYLLQLRPNDVTAEARCLQFSAVSDQEREELQTQIGKYANDLKWKNLELKMQAPCTRLAKSNHTKNYYFEKQDVAAGAYSTLIMPPPSSKPVLSSFNQRRAMRLKLIEGKYLAMMDCVEQFTFLLDKKQHDKPLDPALVKIIQPYLTEGY